MQDKRQARVEWDAVKLMTRTGRRIASATRSSCMVAFRNLMPV